MAPAVFAWLQPRHYPILLGGILMIIGLVDWYLIVNSPMGGLCFTGSNGPARKFLLLAVIVFAFLDTFFMYFMRGGRK